MRREWISDDHRNGAQWDDGRLGPLRPHLRPSIKYARKIFGLLDLLHHWQAEQIPFGVSRDSKWRTGTLSSVDFLDIYNKSSVRWGEIDRWDYSDPSEPLPPSYRLYTGLSLLEYFGVIWILLALHSATVTIVKLVMVRGMRRIDLFMEVFVHILHNMNIPIPWRSWEACRGSMEEHKGQFKKEIRETISVMVVNFFFNSLLLVPLFYTGGSYNVRW